MKSNDFSRLRTMDDIVRRKVVLSDQIAKQEEKLQQHVNHFKEKWSSLASVASNVGNALSFIRPSWVFFKLGLHIAQRIINKRR